MEIYGMWFFTLFTLSLLSIATSIFREQLGEYDRISTHFGFTERAVSHSGSIYAASREGVISSLRPESGVAQWRSFLPTNDHFHKFVIAENVLVTLSSIDLTEFYVRAWRLGSGTLQWEHRIVHQKMASDLITDMMYDSVRGALLVLLPNGVTFMDIKSPTVDFWQWPASESIVLTKLIDPTSSTGSLSSSARVAYGCKVDSSGVCKSTAVVSVSFETHQIAVDQFPSLGVSVNSLHGVISSDIADIESRKKDLLPEDVLFGVSTTEKGKDEAKPVIHVLSLTNDREDLYPLEISGRRSSLVVTTFTLAQPDASILPGVSICYTSISTGENEVQLCSAYALRRKTIGGKESWTMNSIFSGSPNQCASYKVNSMLLERSVAIQSFSYHESLISAVLNLDFCGTVDGVSTQLEGVVIDDRINAYFVELPMKLATEKSLKSFFPSKFPLLVSPSSPQLLVVSTDGLTTMLGSDTSGRMKVIWYYEAALSTIQQVIPFNLDENGGYDEIVQEVLLARERLNMQFDDFKTTFFDFVRNFGGILDLSKLTMLAKSSEAKVHDHFKLFGFNKRMVALSYNRNAQLGKSFFSDFHFQLSAIDLAEDINYSAWRYLPQLSSISSTHATDNNPIVSSVKIFPHKIRRVINDHQHIVHSVLILLTTLEGGVISWNIDLASGKDQGCLTTSENAVPSTLLEKLKSDTCIGSAAFISNLGIHSTFTVLTDSHNSHSEDRKLAMVINSNSQIPELYEIDYDGQIKEQERIWMDNKYLHFLDRHSGTLSIFHQAGNTTGLELASTVLFSPEVEQIITVAYPDPTDNIDSKFSILGDDSVLIKYINPNLLVVATVSPPSSARNLDSDNLTNQSVTEVTLTLSLLDTVTGKVVRRITHDGGVGPVHLAVIENFVIATYWNSEAKRTELSATALYEGAIDRQELSPLASSAARSAAASRYKDTSHKSSYTSIAPMAMQKTYVLPKAVTALHKTLTSNGISNKNLLVAVNGGQIFSLDLRQIHPRRPFSDPSMTEKQEGLLRYSPYIMFNPFQAVTLNYNLPGGPVHNMISVPSSLESTALVFSFGGCSHQSTGGRCSTLDYHANRVMPSQTFDMLASDFNYELLVLILLGLAIGVMMLQRAKKSKLLYSNWA